jgi:hypothetical protein
MVKFYQFSRVVLLQIHFGFGAARIQIRILLNVSDPTGSGSTTLVSTSRYVSELTKFTLIIR